MQRPARGFTLVELMVTVAVLAVLALGALPLAELTVQRAKEQELRSALRQIRTAIDAYKKAADEGHVAKAVDASGYPATLELLVDGAVDTKDAGRRRMHFLRRLPPEPISGQPWGLRSYDSPHDAPQAGKDVFDVYCRCEGVGLNGRPYREW
jgi:general secretion pathway protein G